jgi:hypothetical protein
MYIFSKFCESYKPPAARIRAKDVCIREIDDFFHVWLGHPWKTTPPIINRILHICCCNRNENRIIIQ